MLALPPIQQGRRRSRSNPRLPAHLVHNQKHQGSQRALMRDPVTLLQTLALCPLTTRMCRTARGGRERELSVNSLSCILCQTYKPCSAWRGGRGGSIGKNWRIRPNSD
ncbi:hypothetical protein KP509_20G052400 [Ceratopteris richardii]|uniref:Uncharacterized protein n=1 Tax=Ceratopteris richardii TaxID=49495 RepID=A0A8T2SIW4_CERRI|nr:hypothetical protein KP509_20G052400 [Ceratopteris richardii]